MRIRAEMSENQRLYLNRNKINKFLWRILCLQVAWSDEKGWIALPAFNLFGWGYHRQLREIFGQAER